MYGNVIKVDTMPAKAMRIATATSVPITMPPNRWRGGRLRQASAMTIALSPERRILIQMISTAENQNCGCPRSMPNREVMSSSPTAAAFPPGRQENAARAIGADDQQRPLHRFSGGGELEIKLFEQREIRRAPDADQCRPCVEDAFR